MAYLSSTEDHHGDVRLALTGLHLGIRGNFDLNEILIELYGEDRNFKETEMATFTITSIRLQEKNEKTLSDL